MEKSSDLEAGVINKSEKKDGDSGMPILDRWARKRVFSILSGLQNGAINIIDSYGHLRFPSQGNENGLKVEMTVADSRFYRKLIFGGSLGAAEAYISGWWRCSDLTTLIRIMARNRDAMGGMESVLTSLFSILNNLIHAFHRNSLNGSKRNIAAHYDLSNDFFKLFLDESMMYSSAYFTSDECTLEEASQLKLERICRKLKLHSGKHVLEIGTGWGGFAIHAASKYGCRVTTTTISEGQYELAKRRIVEAGLSDRITLLKKDYRLIEGQYDKVVSIEMIEAVGHRYLPVFFEKCSNSLKPGGIMVLQAITIADQEYERYRKSADFINRYIFPGGCLPSVTAICSAIKSHTEMWFSDMEDMTPSYARTLAEWRSRFFKNLDAVRQIGFSEEFIRMWEYYLCYCEGGFREHSIGSVQMVFKKPQFSSKRGTRT